MAIDVLDEFGNARVTAMRLLFHAATHDRVQIVLQRLHERFGRKTAAFGGFTGLRAIGLQPTLIAQRWAQEARGFHHTIGAAHGVAIKRTRAGQQFAKDHAERPHIAAHLGLPRGLLGRHVGGRADQRLAHGGKAGQRIGAFHSLGDAEVDHARLHHITLDAHQHVRGLQVAVDHALLMRVQHALGGAAEQTQAFAQTQTLQIGMRRDGHARHQRHGEPGAAIFGKAAFEHRRHRRVIHQRQRLLLAAESRQHAATVHAALEQFHRGQTLHGFALRAQQHHAKATLAQFADHLDGAQTRRQLFILGRGRTRSRRGRCAAEQDMQRRRFLLESTRLQTLQQLLDIQWHGTPSSDQRAQSAARNDRTLPFSSKYTTHARGCASLGNTAPVASVLRLSPYCQRSSAITTLPLSVRGS